MLRLERDRAAEAGKMERSRTAPKSIITRKRKKPTATHERRGGNKSEAVLQALLLEQALVMCPPPNLYEDVDAIEGLNPPSTETCSETSLQDEQFRIELRDAARERSTLVALDLHSVLPPRGSLQSVDERVHHQIFETLEHKCKYDPQSSNNMGHTVFIVPSSLGEL